MSLARYITQQWKTHLHKSIPKHFLFVCHPFQRVMLHDFNIFILKLRFWTTISFIKFQELLFCWLQRKLLESMILFISNRNWQSQMKRMLHTLKLFVWGILSNYIREKIFPIVMMSSKLFYNSFDMPESSFGCWKELTVMNRDLPPQSVLVNVTSVFGTGILSVDIDVDLNV